MANLMIYNRIYNNSLENSIDFNVSMIFILLIK